MARKEKNTVDYFPLDCLFGDSIKVVENLYGNDGFVVWIKTLQKLGRCENHYIDCRINAKWKLYYTEMKISEETCLNILDELAELGCIDKKLWENKIIFSENFTKRIADVYDRRKTKLIEKDVIFKEILKNDLFNQKSTCNGINTNINNIDVDINEENNNRNQQIKLNKTKLNKSKLNSSSICDKNLENEIKNSEEFEEEEFFKNLLFLISKIDDYNFEKEKDTQMLKELFKLNSDETKLYEFIVEWKIKTNRKKFINRSCLFSWVKTKIENCNKKSGSNGTSAKKIEVLPPINEAVKTVTNIDSACKFIGKYGTPNGSIEQPVEVQTILNQYNFKDYDAVVEYVYRQTTKCRESS